jgi:peptidoglycan/xylan/chitin deacetylase (PgdA/CDA1 family)
MAYDRSIIPVVMFHSVGLSESNWVFRHVSEPVHGFESKLQRLSNSGYTTVHWQDLYEHMSGKSLLPKNSVMLTFDDGYLDNWVYVFPLVKKHGAKITIFVNPEFVDPIGECRPTSEDVRGGRISADCLQVGGFLSWEEMRTMERTGLVDVQSHALTHTWYFSGPAVVDFHRPNSIAYPWLAWNAQPSEKPYYMTNDQNRFVPWGTPVHEHEKALVCKRYYPSDFVGVRMGEFVRERGGEAFFQDDGWRQILNARYRQLMDEFQDDSRYETEEEYEQRVLGELVLSRQVIERELNKKVDFVCWPGGAYNRKVLSLARKAGYRAWTLSSKDDTNFRNRPGADPCKIKRMGSSYKYVSPGGTEYGSSGSFYFVSQIERHKGSLLHKYLTRMLLLFAMLRSLLS